MLEVGWEKMYANTAEPASESSLATLRAPQAPTPGTVSPINLVVHHHAFEYTPSLSGYLYKEGGQWSARAVKYKGSKMQGQ